MDLLAQYTGITDTEVTKCGVITREKVFLKDGSALNKSKVVWRQIGFTSFGINAAGKKVCEGLTGKPLSRYINSNSMKR